MIPGKYSGLVTCVAAAGMGMFVAMWLLDFTLVRTNWCLGAETKCFREWVGVLSGWAAAFTAAVALLMTIRPLRQQAAEARRQTEFALGESLPTFDVYAEDFTEVYFRIVNWNRRTMLLDEIKFHGVSMVVVASVNTSEEGYIPNWMLGLEDGAGPVFPKAIRIAGYENRNEKPHNCLIRARVTGGIGIGDITGTFYAVGRILGERHGDVVLEATAEIVTFG